MWDRTDRRYNSPTHSFRSTTCDRPTYAGNSDDWLVSRPILIPEWETKVWANFSLWVQGEVGDVAQGIWKFEDYLAFYVEIQNETGIWQSFLVDKYADTDGEWAYPENLKDAEERLNLWGADYDYWNCTKGSGAPWKWWGGVDLDQYFDAVFGTTDPAEKTIRFVFRWVSDPCHHYEGAYIDDFQLLSLRGNIQELVWQEYKPVTGTLLMEPFNTSGFQKRVQFMIPFEPKNGKAYFFEVYSEVVDAVDIDGHYDFNATHYYENDSIVPPVPVPYPNDPGDINRNSSVDNPHIWNGRNESIWMNERWDPFLGQNVSLKMIDLMTGAYYHDPANGVNESVWFGDYHDAAVIDISGPTAVELEMQQCSEIMCTTIPIEITVSNNGTIAEEIPVQAVAKLKVEETIFYDDFEAGPDTWGEEGSWFGFTIADDDADFLPHISDYEPHLGAYHMLIGDDRAFMQPNMAQGANTLIGGDSDSNTGFIANGNELSVFFTYWAKWKMNAEGHSTFGDPGMAIYDVTWDAWAPVLEDPVQNSILGRHPSATLGYKVTGYNGDDYNGPSSPGPYINSDDNDANGGSDKSESLFKIDMLATMDYYTTLLNYVNYEFGYIVITDEDAMPDLAYPGDLWSGLMVDDVDIYAEYPGPIVWESEIQTVFLEPGESKTLDFEWDACEFSFYVIEGRTVLEGDCNHDNDAMNFETYLYHMAFEDDIEDIGDAYSTSTHGTTYRHWESEDNTYYQRMDSPYVSICDDASCDWRLDHYWYFGYEGGPNYPYYMDSILQMVNITDDGELGGPNKDGAFNASGFNDLHIAFDIWVQLQTLRDWFLLEVSPNSGLDWFIVSNDSVNLNWSRTEDIYENEEQWAHIEWDLFNLSANEYFWVYTGYDPLTGFIGSFDITNMSDNLHFRFHMITNGGTEFKGVYIDNVYLNKTDWKEVPWNGHPGGIEWIHEIIFYDGMEDAAMSAMKWITFEESPVGDLWHVSSHYPNSGEFKWGCFDEKAWSSYGKDNYQDVNNSGTTAILYDSDPMRYRSGMEDNLTLTVDLSDKYQAYLYYYENHTLDDPDDYGLLYVSNDGGATWKAVGGTAGLVSGGWIERKVDLTQFLPGVLMIRWSFISGYPDLPAGWSINDEGDLLGDSWEISPPGWGHNSQYCAKLPPSDGSKMDEWLESIEFIYPDFYWWIGVEPSDMGLGDTTITYEFSWYPIYGPYPGFPFGEFNFTVYMILDSKIWVPIDDFNVTIYAPNTWNKRTIVIPDDAAWMDYFTAAAPSTRIAFRARDYSNVMFLVDNVNFEGSWIDFSLSPPWARKLLFNETFESTDIGWEIDDISIRAKADCIEPMTTAIMSPPTPNGCNGYYTSPVTITLTATDNREVAATYYSIDGGTYRTYTAPITINVDGEHTVSFYSVDSVGNEEAPQTVSFKLDATAPTASITSPTSGKIYLFGRELFTNPLGGTVIIGGIDFAASASDATSGLDFVRFEIDGMTYDRAGSPYSIFWHKFDLLPTGYTLTVTPYDEACNTGAAQTLSFTHWL
jgi:hypothetical protein